MKMKLLINILRSKTSRSFDTGASQVALVVKNCLPTQETYETRVRSLGREDSLEKGMATTPGLLSGESPWTEEPGGAIVHRITQSQT